MKEEKDKLSKGFKDKLVDYSEGVNNSLWINIQADIRRSRMLKLRYYYMSAASVVVLLGILTGVLVFSEAPISRIAPIIEDKTIAVDNSTNSTISVIKRKESTTKELLAVLDGKKRESTVELREPIRNESLTLDTYSEEEIVLKTMEEKSDNKVTEKIEEKETTTKEKSLQEKALMTRELLWDIEDEILPKSKSTRRLKLSFMGAGAFAENKSSLSQGIFSIDMTDKITQLSSDSYSPTLTQSSFSTQTNYRTNYKEYEYSYNIPFSFGVSLRVDLPKRFSLETGVFASMLSTTFLLNGESDKKVGTNTMWYLGVPIKANWDFYSTGVWSLYVSAGVAIEKCISSQYSGEKLYFPNLTVESSEDIRAKDFAFQFSANAAIGLQVKLSDLVGLFFEPGVSYYFSANSPIPTIRTDRPFNVSLQAGVRFTL